jgi:hypothetical protein
MDLLPRQMHRSLQCLQCLHCRRRAPCRHRLQAVTAARRPGGRGGTPRQVVLRRARAGSGTAPLLRGFMMQRQDAGSAAAPRPWPDPF